MKKIRKSNELVWLLGVITGSLGVCLAIKAGFGLSVFAAPPYIIHHALHNFHWLTHGMTDIAFQFIMLVLLVSLMHHLAKRYFLCFATTVITAMMLDGWLALLGGDGIFENIALRIVGFVIGELAAAFSLACFSRTSLPIQIDELFIEEFAEHIHKKEHTVMVAEEIVFLVLSLVLALGLNRSLHGLGIGTILSFFLNEYSVHFIGKGLDKVFEYKPMFPKLSEKLKIY